MENVIEERTSGTKFSWSIFFTIVLIVAIIVFYHYWRLPLVGTFTGAMVCMTAITSVIAGFLLYVLVKNALVQAQKKKESLDLAHRYKLDGERAKTKNAKIAIAMKSIQTGERVLWKEILYVSRSYNMDISKFYSISGNIHLADLSQMITLKEITPKRLYWDGGDLHNALTIIKDIAEYQHSIPRTDGIEKFIIQLNAFQKHCKRFYKNFVGYKELIGIVRPTLRDLRKLVAESN